MYAIYNNNNIEQWSSIQQQQLEEGLKKYPQSCNLSKTERWKAISDMVDVSFNIYHIITFLFDFFVLFALFLKIRIKVQENVLKDIKK